jgi:hypothetical protein
MGALFTRRPYENQPDTAAVIDVALPQPVNILLPSAGYIVDALRGDAFTLNGTPSLTNSDDAVGVNLSGNDYIKPRLGDFSADFTILAVFRKHTTDTITLYQSSIATNAAIDFMVYDNKIELARSGASSVLSVSDSLLANRVYVVCVTWDNTNGKGAIYLDGNLRVSASIGSQFWNTNDNPAIGTREGNGTYAAAHTQYLFVKWNQALPFDAARGLSANPWQLFTARRFAAQVAGVGGGGGEISSNLFWDASGQLVIAESLPDGGSTVTLADSEALADVAPWMRGLDATDAALWHPAKYYSGGPETTVPIPGGNLMPNADLSFGADYWEVLNNAGGGTNYSGPTRDLSDNAPAGSHSVGVSRSGTTQAASDVFDIVYNKRINVLPSTRYEMSGYMASTNCTPSIFPKFYKLVAGVETAVSSSDIFTTTAAAGGDDLSDWNRAGGFFTTPADAQYVKFCIRGSAASAADPVFWGSKLFVGQAYPGQTELSPWVAGGNSGAFGELEQLTSLHDEYEASVTIPTGTTTIAISSTFTSVISPARARKLLVAFSCESPTTNTYGVYVDFSSGSFSDTKTIYDSASNNISVRLITFSVVLSVPAGYDVDITVDVKIRQEDDGDRNYQQVSLSVLEIPT